MCALNLLMCHGPLVLNLTKWQCPHQNPQVQHASVIISPVRCILNAAIICVFITVLIGELFELLDSTLTKVQLLFIFMRILELMAAIFALTASQIQQNTKIKELSGLIRITENLSSYGISVLINDHCVCMIRGFLIFMHTFGVAYIYVTYIEIKLQLNKLSYFDLYRKIISENTQAVNGGIVFTYTCHCLFYKEMYSTCMERIKQVLNYRILATRGMPLYHNEELKGDLEYYDACKMQNVQDHLIKLHRLYIAIHSNMIFGIKFTSPLFLFWWTLLLLLLINNVYIVVAFLFINELSLQAHEQIMIIKHLISFTTTCLFLQQSHKLHFVVIAFNLLTILFYSIRLGHVLLFHIRSNLITSYQKMSSDTLD